MLTSLPITLFTLLWSNTASALDCMDGVVDMVPADGAINLPQNTIPILLFAYDTPTAEDITIHNSDSGDILESTLVELYSGAYTTVPSTNFEANANYEIRYNSREEIVTSFSVGEEIDEEPPSQSVILEVSRENGSDEWGSWDLLLLNIEGPTDSAYFMIEVADNPDFSDSQMAVDFPSSGDDGLVLSIGSGLCGGNLPRSEIENIRYLRVTAYDIAGNASSVSESQQWSPSAPENETEEDKASGCSSLPATTTGLWGLIGCLAVLGGRRRNG